MDAETICANLGTSVDDVAESADWVDSYCTFRDQLRPQQTSCTLPTGESVHLHQLVDDDEGERFIVVGISETSLEVCQVYPPDDYDYVGFGGRYELDLDTFAEIATPLTAGNGQPIWGY